MTTRRQITIDIDNDVHATGFILQQMKTLDLSSSYYSLHTDAKARMIGEMIQALQVIEAIAWEEHTCDWDLSLTIELHDGVINTLPGYSVMELEGHTIKIEDDPSTNAPYDKDADNHYWSLNISNIKSITVHVH